MGYGVELPNTRTSIFTLKIDEMLSTSIYNWQSITKSSTLIKLIENWLL